MEYICEAPKGYKVKLLKKDGLTIAIATNGEKVLQRIVDPVLEEYWQEINLNEAKENDKSS